MSLAGRYNFRIQRGADSSLVFQKNTSDGAIPPVLTPVNLTGLKVRAQIRDTADEFGTTTDATLLLDMANGDGVAITDAVNGKVTFALTEAQTIALCPLNQKTTVSYGIEIYNDGVTPETVQPLLQGRITIKPEVSR